MKIAYLPIDERPCNVDYVDRIAQSSIDIELILPDFKWLGNKKVPANTDRLWQWVKKYAIEVDALILSVDMLVYGGMIPSRLHYMTEQEGKKRMNQLRNLKAEHPDLLIYASNLIMRAPKYSSGDEEPDYYEEWGQDLFYRSYYLDKQQRDVLPEKDSFQLNEIESRLPTKWINDYETRRTFNLNINKGILELVSEGVINFLTIPQDDSAQYGYTAMDQKQLVSIRNNKRLYEKVHIYPGADEVGATLLSRVYNDYIQRCPKIYPFWSSTLGSQLIPMYEDRPFGESLKAHVLAAGCELTNSPEDADLILAYNTPGRVMQESWEQNAKDITYSSFRNILFFVKQIQSYIDKGKNVIVADSAFANGGDFELLVLLDEKQLLDQITSYKGWNTNCNTLGTTISQGVFSLNGKKEKIRENIIYHLLDDYFYQTEIRMELVSTFLPTYDLTYFNLKDKVAIVNEKRNERLLNRYNEVIRHSFHDMTLKEIKTFAPWNRMFECGFQLKF